MHTLIGTMRIGLFILLLSVGIVLTQSALHASSRPGRVTDERPAGAQVMLNGNSLDYTLFSIFSRGKLTLVTGDFASGEAVAVPFRIYLRRDGLIVNKGASDSGRQLYTVDVAKVLMLARPGDELIIEPVRQVDRAARRIIRVKTPFWPLPLNWLPQQPGC